MSDSALATPPTETTTPSPETTTSETTPSPQSDAPPSLLGEEAKAEETPAPQPFDAEKVTFPEGMTKDDPLFDKFTNIAKEHGWTGAAAQAVLDLAAEQSRANVQKQSAEWAKQQEEWQAAVRSDPDIGGDKLAGHLQTFARFAQGSGLFTPGYLKALAFSGMGNNPDVVKTHINIANAFGEGAPVRGNPSGSARQPETLGQAIYGPDGPHVGGPKR